MKPRTRDDMTVGLTGAAKDLIAKATTSDRHKDRVAATQDACQEWLRDRLVDNNGIEDDIRSASLLLLIADKCMPGTTRHEAFRGLGKGRKEATDGGAYMAATDEVIGSYIRDLGVVSKWGRVVFSLDVEVDEETPDLVWVEYWSLYVQTGPSEGGHCRLVYYAYDLDRLLGHDGAVSLIGSLLEYRYFGSDKAPVRNIVDRTCVASNESVENWGLYYNYVASYKVNSD